MALAVSEIHTLRTYLNGVMQRADHHAHGVNEVALALTGAILWRMSDRPLKIMAQDGASRNVLWFATDKGRYAFAYDQTAGVIELRKDRVQGTLLHTFDNQVLLADVRRIFQEL